MRVSNCLYACQVSCLPVNVSLRAPLQCIACAPTLTDNDISELANLHGEALVIVTWACAGRGYGYSSVLDL
jgi:hypothetical protein